MSVCRQTRRNWVDFRVGSGLEEGWIQTGALTVNCEGVGGGAVALLVRGAGAGAAGIEGGLLLLLRLERLAHVAVVVAARVPEALQRTRQGVGLVSKC